MIGCCHPSLVRFIQQIRSILTINEYDLINEIKITRNKKTEKKYNELRQIMSNIDDYPKLEYLERISAIFRKYNITH